VSTFSILPQNIPYYLKRISDCYRFFDLPDTSAIENDQQAQFLKHLSKRAEEWQVQQADRAARCYDAIMFTMRNILGVKSPLDR